MTDKHQLEITKLQRQITSLSNILAHLTTDEDLKHLLQVIKRPGWTTPAEFAYAMALLRAMQFQVNAIVMLKKQLVQTGEQVLSTQDPIPPKAHVEEMGKLVTDISEALANLKSDEDLKHLIQIIKRPGYTTPAEFAFSAALLNLVKVQAATLKNLTAQVTKGSELVAGAKG